MYFKLGINEFMFQKKNKTKNKNYSILNIRELISLRELISYIWFDFNTQI